MTTEDLHLEYKKDTGQYSPMINDDEICTSTYTDYVKWLEDQLLFIRNTLAINERALIKLKEM